MWGSLYRAGWELLPSPALQSLPNGLPSGLPNVRSGYDCLVAGLDARCGLAETDCRFRKLRFSRAHAGTRKSLTVSLACATPSPAGLVVKGDGEESSNDVAMGRVTNVDSCMRFGRCSI